MRNVNEKKSKATPSIGERLIKVSFVIIGLVMVAAFSSAFFAGAYHAIVVER